MHCFCFLFSCFFVFLLCALPSLSVHMLLVLPYVCLCVSVYTAHTHVHTHAHTHVHTHMYSLSTSLCGSGGRGVALLDCRCSGGVSAVQPDSLRPPRPLRRAYPCLCLPAFVVVPVCSSHLFSHKGEKRVQLALHVLGDTMKLTGESCLLFCLFPFVVEQGSGQTQVVTEEAAA